MKQMFKTVSAREMIKTHWGQCKTESEKNTYI